MGGNKTNLKGGLRNVFCSTIAEKSYLVKRLFHNLVQFISQMILVTSSSLAASVCVSTGIKKKWVHLNDRSKGDVRDASPPTTLLVLVL